MLFQKDLSLGISRLLGVFTHGFLEMFRIKPSDSEILYVGKVLQAKSHANKNRHWTWTRLCLTSSGSYVCFSGPDIPNANMAGLQSQYWW